MDYPEYKEKVEKALKTPLTTESPEQMFKEIAYIESLSYMTVKLAHGCETTIAEFNDDIRKGKAKLLSECSGTQMEKTIQLEEKLASLLNGIEVAEAEMKYWRAVGRLIENKISLAQSILGNITSQIKAGMYVDNVK